MFKKIFLLLFLSTVLWFVFVVSLFDQRTNVKVQPKRILPFQYNCPIPPNAQCQAVISPSSKTLLILVPKAASSTMRSLFTDWFPDAYTINTCRNIPADYFKIVFFRDPVLRFLSGYEESIARSVRKDLKKRSKRLDETTERIKASVGTHTNWLEYWNDTRSQAHQTFYDYVMYDHDISNPFNAHMALQSAYVARIPQKIDFIGSIDNLKEDWQRLRLQLGKPIIHNNGRENRKNHWKHLTPEKLPQRVLAKICENAKFDFNCLHINSKYCS
tara:strand:- start:680 stop:1495 length:816 start_codon:yes stop_codon:yes gene_type:complete